MKATFYSGFIAAAKQGPRLFFAPLVGAINAMREESARIASGGIPTEKERSSLPLKRRRRRK